MNRIRTRRATLLFTVSISLLMTLLLIGCQSGASQSTTALSVTTSVPTSLPSGTTSVASSTTTTTTGNLVILLTEVSSQPGYYNRWQGAAPEPLFALWADGSMRVRVAGGYAATPPVYEEAMLTAPEVEQLRGWAAEADLSTLAHTYPLPAKAGGVTDLSVWRLEVGDGQTASTVTFEKFPYPADEASYPARLRTFVDQLMSYRPPEQRAFVPELIDVLVVERAPIKATTSALPPEFDPKNMGVQFRSVEEVRYTAVYDGEEAARVRARLDAGQYFYNTERRSYYVYYMPLVEWPMPSPPPFLGTTSTATAVVPSSESKGPPATRFVAELRASGLTVVTDYGLEDAQGSLTLVVVIQAGPTEHSLADYQRIYDQVATVAARHGANALGFDHLRVSIVTGPGLAGSLDARELPLTASPSS